MQNLEPRLVLSGSTLSLGTPVRTTMPMMPPSYQITITRSGDPMMAMMDSFDVGYAFTSTATFGSGFTATGGNPWSPVALSQTGQLHFDPMQQSVVVNIAQGALAGNHTLAFAITASSADYNVSGAPSVSLTLQGAAEPAAVNVTATTGSEGMDTWVSATTTAQVSQWKVLWGDEYSGQAPQDVGGNGTMFGASHTWRDNGQYVLNLKGYDMMGQLVAAGTQTITVTNVAPTWTNLPHLSNAPFFPGDTVTLSAAFTDPADMHDVYAWQINWGDGSDPESGTLANRNISQTHLWEAPGANQVELTVTDGDGGTLTWSESVTVGELAPTIEVDLGEGGTIPEGQDFSIELTAATPIDEWTITWGDGTGTQTVTSAGTSVWVNHKYLDNSPEGGYEIQATARRGSYTEEAEPRTVTVENVPPVVEGGLVLSNSTPFLGETITATATLADGVSPSSDTLHWKLLWGDEAIDEGEGNGTISLGQTHEYLEAGDYTVTLKVWDDDMTEDDAVTRTVDITVQAPELTITPLGDLTEGQMFSLNVSSTGPVSGWEIYWDDHPDEEDPTPERVVASGNTLSLTHTYLDDGEREIRVVAMVRDIEAAEATETVQVVSIPPTFTTPVSLSYGYVNAQYQPVVGSMVTLTVGFETHENSVDVTTYRIEWGDGQQTEEDAQSIGQINASHTYATADDYTITVSLWDDDMDPADAETISSQQFTIAPAPLTIVANSDMYGMVQDTTLTVSAEDGILANDGVGQTEEYKAQFVLSIVSGPSHGTLSLDAGSGSTGRGGFSYTPDAGWSGTDSFVYRLVDPNNPFNPVDTTVFLDVGDYKLKSVVFDLDQKMKADPGHLLSPSEWRVDGTSGPVAYYVGQNMIARAYFLLSKPPQQGAKPPNILAEGSDGIKFAVKRDFRQVGSEWYLVVKATATDPFKKVRYVPEFTIDWTLGEGTKQQVLGTSENTLYVTLKKADMASESRNGAAIPLYHSLVHIGCKAADGKMTADEVATAVMGAFKSHELKNAFDQKLKYYGDWNEAPASQSTEKLLENRDGNCNAWTELFLDVLKAQGLRFDNDPDKKFTDHITVKPGGGAFQMFVATWTFNGAGHTAAYLAPNQGNLAQDYPYINIFRDGDPATRGEFNFPLINNPAGGQWVVPPTETKPDLYDEPGVDGQNQTNPPSVFKNHVVARIKVGGQVVIFDPSYGNQFDNLGPGQGGLSSSIVAYGTLAQVFLDEAKVGVDLDKDGQMGIVRWMVLLARKPKPTDTLEIQDMGGKRY